MYWMTPNLVLRRHGLWRPALGRMEHSSNTVSCGVCSKEAAASILKRPTNRRLSTGFALDARSKYGNWKKPRVRLPSELASLKSHQQRPLGLRLHRSSVAKSLRDAGASDRRSAPTKAQLPPTTSKNDSKGIDNAVPIDGPRSQTTAVAAQTN